MPPKTPTSPGSSTSSAVFVGSADGHLYAFHADDGALWWRRFCGHSPPDYGVRSSPALSSDEAVVFVGSADGQVYAFRTGLAG